VRKLRIFSFVNDVLTLLELVGVLMIVYAVDVLEALVSIPYFLNADRSLSVLLKFFSFISLSLSINAICWYTEGLGWLPFI